MDCGYPINITDYELKQVSLPYNKTLSDLMNFDYGKQILTIKQQSDFSFLNKEAIATLKVTSEEELSF